MNIKLLLFFVIISALIFLITVPGQVESQELVESESSNWDKNKELKLLRVIGGTCVISPEIGPEEPASTVETCGLFTSPTDLAIGESGNIYLADYGGKRIQILDSLGKVIQTIDLKGSPHGITLDKDENIYVTEWWDFVGVEKFTKTGEPATDFQIEDQSVLGLPSDIIVDPDGIVYVSQSHTSDGLTFTGMGVHKISADGEYLEFLPVPETVTVPHSGASLMAIDKEGYLYLVDQKGANIIILDPSNGNVKVLDFEYSGHVQGIAFNPEGFMFVPDWEPGSSHCSNCQVASIHVFDEYHLPITTIGEYGTEDGKLNATHGLEFDKDGNMYVLDYDNSRLQVFHIDPKVFGSLIYEETEKITPVPTQSEISIPTWIKNNAGWWSNGEIPDSAFVSGIQWLISNGIMNISS